MYTGLQVKYALFLSDFNQTWTASTDFLKTLKYQISSKSVQWEPSCSKQTGRQTDKTKLIVAFLNSVNAPERYVQGSFNQFNNVICITAAPNEWPVQHCTHGNVYCLWVMIAAILKKKKSSCKIYLKIINFLRNIRVHSKSKLHRV